MKQLFLGLSLFFGSVFLVGCGNDSQAQGITAPSEAENQKISIMTTFFPMYDFTRNIVGDLAEGALLIPAGSDAHDYELSAQAVAKVQQADAFVYNNENFEVWVPGILAGLEDKKVAVVNATKEMSLLSGSACVEAHNGEATAHDHSHDHDHSHSHDHSDDEADETLEVEATGDHNHAHDPHIWLSPKRALEQVTLITAQLATAFPDLAPAFQVNAQKYLERLKSLDATYAETLSTATQKKFFTQHAAFGYLAHDYELTQEAIVGLSTNEEPSAQRLAALKETIQAEKVTHIFAEAQTTGVLAETLASEARVKLLTLNTLESVSQNDIEAGHDYLSIMEENLAALKQVIK